MPKIFICYRREDSRWPAQTIYNDLVDHFGSESVVWDIDSIPYGVDFREYLNKEVSKCDILLAVIGDKWLEILKQRLDQPNDFVRIEIQAALKRGIPVVPILVGKKSVPSEKDLPPELANLSYKQAAEVRAGTDLQSHLKRLVDGLDHLFSESKVGEDIKQKQVDKELKREETPKKFTNSIGMTFVLIPAGIFKMGTEISPEEAISRYGGIKLSYKYEYPQHDVKISNPFYLQSTQVTQGQWKKIMNNNPSHFKNCGDDCPVEKVSWKNTQEFIKILNNMENTSEYRLPSEAEWEYACRAGTTTAFSFGDEIERLDKYAWFGKNSGKSTHPVGTKKPNPWGLYDMYGNVFEWVEDRWHNGYLEAPANGLAWIAKETGPLGFLTNYDRVVRGGGYQAGVTLCRSASRLNIFSTVHEKWIGFRLSKSVFRDA
jgi:formylglycine-generating enzyme required for sulfatase activity